MYRKILIMGLPGSGKTTLANELRQLLPAVYWNADDVRREINSHLTFSLEDRIKQAKTMKFLADTVNESGKFAIVDFVCPTPETREAFGMNDTFVVWVDRIKTGRFEDTNMMFVPPEKYNLRVCDDGRPADDWADDIASEFIW